MTDAARLEELGSAKTGFQSNTFNLTKEWLTFYALYPVSDNSPKHTFTVIVNEVKDEGEKGDGGAEQSEAAETDYLQLELRHNPGGDTQGYTDGLRFTVRPHAARRTARRQEGRRPAYRDQQKRSPRRSNSTCRRRSSHSPHGSCSGPPLCGPDFCPAAAPPAEARVVGRFVLRNLDSVFRRQAPGGPPATALRAGLPPGEAAGPRAMPGSRSTPAVRPEPASGPPPGALFFSPRGRRFAENRYLCIMSIVRNTESDLEFENKIRPQELENFSGQDKIVENLHIFIKAALMRGDSLDHVLLHGPGTGQDDPREHHRQRNGAQLRVTSGPVLDKPGDLAGLLTNLNPGDVLFIDEIHRLSPIVEEYLYSAMEDYKIDIVLDKGPRPARSRSSLALHAHRRHHAQRPADFAP